MPFYPRGLELLLPNGTDHRWVGLLAAAPDELTGAYQEIADSEYVRVLHDAWMTIDNGDGRAARVNDGAVVFGNMVDLDETVIPWWGIFGNDIGGLLIAAGPCLNSDGEPQPLVVGIGNQPRFNHNDLRLLSSCKAVE